MKYFFLVYGVTALPLVFALTLQRLPTTLFRFRFEGVKDGGADKQVGKCTHDQGYRAHILFLHSSFRRVLGGGSLVQWRRLRLRYSLQGLSWLLTWLTGPHLPSSI